MLHAVRDWIKRHRPLRDELAGFSRAEFSHLASDMGVTETDLQSLSANAPDNTVLMQGMMRARGLDPEKVRDHYITLARDIERVCTICRNAKRCRRELAAGTAGMHCHEFCPNVRTFDDLDAADMGCRIDAGTLPVEAARH